MKAAVRVLCFWGVADGILLAALPKVWLAFWAPKLEALTDSHKRSVPAGLFQVSVCLYLIKMLSGKKGK